MESTAHQPASSPTSKRGGVKGDKVKTTADSASATPRQKKRAVAAHVQMAPEDEDPQQPPQQQQAGGGEFDPHHNSYQHDSPTHQHAGHHAPPPSLYLNGLHHSAQQLAAHNHNHNHLAFSLASPNPLSSSNHLLLTPGAPHAMMTPNGTNYNLSTYPSLDAGNLDLESMTSAGSYRTSSGGGGGSASVMQTPMAGGTINSMMQFSPNPAVYGQAGQAPLMQYATSVDAQLQHVQQQIQIQQAILAQHQQAQGGYPFTAAAAASASPSFSVPQPARGTSFVVDTDDEQSTVGGAAVGGAGSEFPGEGDNDSEYSNFQPHRNPTMHASGLTVEQMQALRLQQRQSISPDLAASQSNLMRQAGLDQRRAMEEGVHGNHAGSMSVPSKTRSISGRSNAADRLSISPLTISRGMSGEDRPAGASVGVERLSLGTGADSNRNSPRFSSRTLSGRGNSSTTPSTAVSDPVVSGQEDSSVGLSPAQLAELEPLMAGMNAAQRQSFLAEAKALNSSSNHVASGSISSTVPSPHSGSPRSAKRKIAAAATTGAAGGANNGGAQPPAVDLSCPNQHVKYQMVARLKSQMGEGHSAGGAVAGATSGNTSNGSSPVLTSPADDDVIARTKLLQNEQKQMRLQHAMDEERRRLAALTGQAKRTSPSQVHRDLNINVKAEQAHQQPQQHPSASPPNGLPPSHNTPTSGARRAQQNKLPSPLTHLSSLGVPPVVPPHAQFNNPGPLLFSPVPPVFQSHGGGGGVSGSLAAGAQSPSTMLNLVDSVSSSSSNSNTSSAGSSGNSSLNSSLASSASGMFSPPAPMFASSHHSMLPGQNNYSYPQQLGGTGAQPDYLQWGSGSAAGSSSHHAAALSMLSPLPGSLHLSFPGGGSSTPGPGLSALSAAGHPASLALFSPNPMMLASSSSSSLHVSHGGHGGNGQGGSGLFSPDAYSSTSMHYPAPLVPVLPASHDTGLDSSLSHRQLSAGGQNLQMGGLDDGADFMRQSSANLNSGFGVGMAQVAE